MNAYCMTYEKEFGFGNVSIVKGDNGKLGMIDPSNTIVGGGIRYDSIQPLRKEPLNRYLKVVENGYIGIYDAIRVDFVQYCKLSKITKIERGVVYGKEPFKLFGIVLFNWSVKIELDGYTHKK